MKWSSYIANPFKKIEDRPTPKEVYNWKIYGSAFVIAAAALEIGYDSGFIGGTLALESFKKEFGLDKLSSAERTFVNANIISVFHAGCFFGSAFSYYFNYRWGRKLGLILSSFVMALGAILMCCARDSTGLGPIYAGRAIAGLGVGASTGIVPVYLAEISPPAVRGIVSSCYEIGWRIGDLNGFFISYGVDSNIPSSRKQWFVPFAVQIIPAGLYLLGVFWLYESPRWLVTKGREEEALENLSKLRNLPRDHEYVIWEHTNIIEEVDSLKKNIGLGVFDPLREIVKKPNIQKRLLITVSLYILQSLYGIQSINYYSPTIFKQVGITSTNMSLFSTGLFGVDKFVSTIIWSLFVVEQFGRRTTLLFASPVCIICHFYIGGYISVGGGGSAGTAALALIYVFGFFFILSWSGTPYIVGSEIFDSNIRAFCQVLNSMGLWLGVFLMTRFTGQMIEKMSYGIFFFFGAFGVLSLPFIYFLLPETKGIPLEQMDKLFSYPAWKAHKIVMNELQIEGGIIKAENMEVLKDLSEDKGQNIYVEDVSVERKV